MSLSWFRLYAEIVDDVTLQCLSFEDQRHFVWILALKCGGVIDKEYPKSVSLDFVVGRKLGLQGEALTSLKDRLLEMRLIDVNWQPSQWEKRQFISDNSSARVKRYRERRAQSGLKSQGYVAPKVREKVFEKDGHKCICCGATADLTIDHIVSEFRGGSNEISNLQTLCRACNGAKRDLDNETFLERYRNAPRLQITDTDKPPLPPKGGKRSPRLVSVDWPCPDSVRPETWQAWIDVRRSKRAPFTDAALKVALNRISQLRLAGYEPQQIVESAAMSNWTAFYEPKGPPQRKSLADAMRGAI